MPTLSHVVSLLLGAGACRLSPDGRTAAIPLHLAAAEGHVPTIDALLAPPPPPAPAGGAPDKPGPSAATRAGVGAGLEAASGLGTPLQWAVMARRSAAVRHLLETYQACPDPPPARGTGASPSAAVPPPLVMAAALGDAETCAALLAAGADANAADADGDTALRHALAAGNAGLAALLRRHGAVDGG